MDNFTPNDYTLFEFDYQNDFTDGEHRIINDMLGIPVESAKLFETDASFDASRTSSSSFFDYLCNDTGSAGDVAALDNLPENQLKPFESGLNQVGHEVNGYVTESENLNVATVDQDANFDWTTFLDKSPVQDNVIEESPSPTLGVASESVQNELENVICDNGFVYQELKTLDVPQMYANLDQTFGLMDLKKIDENMDYSSLPTEHQTCQEDRNIINNNAPTMKQKLFLLPMQLNQSGTDSLYKVSRKLKNNPFALNSMLNQCSGTESKIKLLLPSRPKRIKQKSERYLTVNEQLERIHTKEIILPSIAPKMQREKRKEAPKLDKEKVPVAYAFEVVLTNIMENNNDSDTVNNNQSISKKATKPRKTNSKPSKRPANETLDESKPNRRSCKKIKSN